MRWKSPRASAARTSCRSRSTRCGSTTHAEPAFGEGATLTSLPSDAVDAGEEIAYALAVRNSGDGAAKRLSLRLDPPSNAVYAPGSTSVNEVPLLDFAGTSPLLAISGLTLGDVGAGVEVIARLRMIVNTPLPAGSFIETRAYVTWDEMPEMIVRGEPLRVRSSPALPIVDPLLPFSVIDAAAAPAGRNGQRQLPRPEEYMELPPATPVRNGPRQTTAPALPGADPRTAADTDAGSNDGYANDDVTLSLSKGAPPSATEEKTPTTVFLDLTEERLAWTRAVSRRGAVQRHHRAPHGTARAVPRPERPRKAQAATFAAARAY